MLQLAMVLVVSLWNWKSPWPISWWSVFWMVNAVAIPCVIAFATLIWFSIGGIRDMRDFFRALRTMKRDASDDGRVEDALETRSRDARVASVPSAR